MVHRCSKRPFIDGVPDLGDDMIYCTLRLIRMWSSTYTLDMYVKVLDGAKEFEMQIFKYD